MNDDYRRCDTCIHYDCLGDCTNCVMLRPCEEFGGECDGCGCVAYQFDRNGDCKYYNYGFKEETNGAQ